MIGPNSSAHQVGNFGFRMIAGSILAVALWCAVTGCGPPGGEKFLQTQRELQAAKEQVSKLESQLADEQKTVRQLQNQVATARGMSPDVLKQLATPVRIQLASQSGGYDTDNKPGDDGIVLYVQPIDQDGDPIKATGSMRVTLLDLTEPASPKVIATYDFDVSTTRKLWYGRLLTNHYTVRCPWPPGGPPKADKVTTVVEFTDLLTGRVLTAQNAYEFKRPPVVASKPG